VQCRGSRPEGKGKCYLLTAAFERPIVPEGGGARTGDDDETDDHSLVAKLGPHAAKKTVTLPAGGSAA